MYGSPMSMGESSALDKKTTEIVSGTKLGDFEEKQDEEENKYDIFDQIHCLSRAACEMYVDGDLSFDEAITELSQAIMKFKGKEAELLAAAGEEDDAGEVD